MLALCQSIKEGCGSCSEMKGSCDHHRLPTDVPSHDMGGGKQLGGSII